MGDNFEHLVYEVNIKIRKDNSRRIYVSFVDFCFEIEFTRACFGKLVISLSKFDILRIEVEVMKKKYW